MSSQSSRLSKRERRELEAARQLLEGSSRPHVTTTTTTLSYQSSLPLPGILEGYERVLPGSAHRILTMAEDQSVHRRRLEEKVVTGNSRREWVGQVMAFILALVVLYFGYDLIRMGKETGGLVAIIGALVTLLGLFVAGKVTERRAVAQKPQAALAPRPQ